MRACADGNGINRSGLGTGAERYGIYRAGYGTVGSGTGRAADSNGTISGNGCLLADGYSAAKIGFVGIGGSGSIVSFGAIQFQTPGFLADGHIGTTLIVAAGINPHGNIVVSGHILAGTAGYGGVGVARNKYRGSGYIIGDHWRIWHYTTRLTANGHTFAVDAVIARTGRLADIDAIVIIDGIAASTVANTGQASQTTCRSITRSDYCCTCACIAGRYCHTQRTGIVAKRKITATTSFSTFADGNTIDGSGVGRGIQTDGDCIRTFGAIIGAVVRAG